MMKGRCSENQKGAGKKQHYVETSEPLSFLSLGKGEVLKVQYDLGQACNVPISVGETRSAFINVLEAGSKTLIIATTRRLRGDVGRCAMRLFKELPD